MLDFGSWAIHKVYFLTISNIQPGKEKKNNYSPRLSSNLSDSVKIKVRVFLPVEKWLYAVAFEPNFIIDVQIVPVPMSWVDLNTQIDL